MKSFEPFWNSTGTTPYYQEPSTETWNPSNPSEILLVLLLTTKNPAPKHEILRTLLKFYWYYSLLPRTQHWSMKSFKPFWNSTGTTPYYQEPSTETWNPSNPSEILLVLLLTTKNPAPKHEILRTLLKFYWYYSLLPRTQHWNMKSFEEPFWNSTDSQDPSAEAWNPSNPSEILLVLLLPTKNPALKHEILRRTLLKFYWYYSLLPGPQRRSMKSFELFWNSTGTTPYYQEPSTETWNPSNPSEILLVLLLTTKNPALKHEILQTLLKFYWYYSILPRTQHWSMKSFKPFWNSTDSQDPSAEAWNPSNPSEILLVLLLTTKNPALKHEILRTLLKFYWYYSLLPRTQHWSMKSFEDLFWNSTDSHDPSAEAWNPSNPSEILLVLLLTTKNPALKHEILRRTHLKFYWFSTLLPRISALKVDILLTHLKFYWYFSLLPRIPALRLDTKDFHISCSNLISLQTSSKVLAGSLVCSMIFLEYSAWLSRSLNTRPIHPTCALWQR